MLRLLLLITVVCCSTLLPAQVKKHGRLIVSPDNHYLQYEDGTPFFWLGDTGWQLFERLTIPEIKKYLDNRAAKGFNVIQAVALAEFDVKKPNRYGHLALHNMDPLKPNEHYFSLVDTVVKLALQRNIFIGMVATWGDKVLPAWGEGPVIFDSTKAYRYGNWLANRYKKYPNIIWILGGDRPVVADTANTLPVWQAMAKGIIDATKGKCIITYHPSGARSSSQWLQQESWLHFNMGQSSHGRHDAPNWAMIKKDWNLSPTKPTLDAEPNYEDHPVNPWPKWNVDSGYFRDYDVRKQLYRSVFAGGCGVTYGHHALWQFLSERDEVVNHADRGWVNAMDRSGAYQAGYLRKLVESRPMKERTPDISFITEGQEENYSGHIEAYRGADNSYAMIYLPIGKKITVNTSFIKGSTVTAWWFNPKDASVQKIGIIQRNDQMEFTPPTTGLKNDWVLVIDDADKKYKQPGAPIP